MLLRLCLDFPLRKSNTWADVSLQSKSSVQEQIVVLKKMLTGQNHGQSSEESFA